MPIPKSVTKIDKTGNVTFISDVEKAEYYLFELTRAALRDVGKFVIKQFQMSYYNTFKKHTGLSKKALKAKVFSNANTIYPRVDIGLSSSAKAFYSMFQEFGTSKTKRLGLLTNAVKDNISTIRQIEAQYLEYIDADDAVIESKINEEETDED